MAAPGVSSSAGRASGTSSGSNDASYSMSSVSASLPGGGLAPSIQLRTKSPLPFFTCPHPIPPASATIGSTLKLSVLRLLTGEVSLKSSTAPMTESENLKLMTIHGWRSEMIALELRQNVLIAPETRNRIGEGIDDEMEGFELADDSDCGLLESGDEVLIRIKPAFALPDLHLPKLPKDHTYSLPPGALTRAGTLSAPPSYSQANIKRAAEPSSHSSSVQAQPNANYHARQYRDYSKGYRVVTVGGGAQGGSSNAGPNNFGMTAAEIRRAKASSNPATSGPSRPLGLGAGVEPPAAMPAAAQYRPADIKTKRSSSYNKKDSQQAGGSRTLPSPLLPASTTASPAPTSPANIPSPSITPASSQNPGRRPSAPRASTGGSYSYFNQDTKGAGNSSGAATSSNAMQQVFGSGGPAGQEAMPSSALVIGPGVQGSIGKGSSSAVGQSGNTTGDSGHSPMASIAEHGNAKAFTGFTAASGEVKARGKQRAASHSSSTENGRSEVRRATTRNKSYEVLSRGNAVGGSGEQPTDPARAAVEAAERRAAAARAALNESLASNGHNGSSSKTNGSSQGAKTVEQRDLPARRDLPPIAHVSPFPPTSGPEEAEEEPSRSYFSQGAVGSQSPPNAAATPPYSPKPADFSVISRRAQSQPSSAGEAEYPFVDAPLPPIPRDEEDEMGQVPPLAQGSGGHTRPAHTRMVSTGGESAVSKSSKKEGRFSRLAAPGLGFGSRRQSSKSSVPKAEGYEGGTPTSEKEATRVEPSSILAPRLGLGPRQLSSKKSITKAEGQDTGGNGEREYGAGQPIAEDEPASPSTPAFVDAETGEPENYFDGGGGVGGGKKLSRAERRYLEFQKSYQAELTRQEQADRHRLSEREARRVESEKEQRKKEEEARIRREKEKWQIWEEVRKRA